MAAKQGKNGDTIALAHFLLSKNYDTLGSDGVEYSTLKYQYRKQKTEE